MFLRNLVGRFVSSLIMPSQLICPHPLPNAFPQGNDPRITLEDGAKIDFWSTSQAEHPEKLIIHAVGNGDRYEHHIEEYQEEAQNFPNARIVAFNFRNVSNSTGRAYSEEDWIKDALAVIDHFRAQGFRSENILLSGHSLGAAILTLAAAKDYENRGRQDCVRVLNNRTFSDLSTEIARGILGMPGCSIVLLLCSPLFLFYSPIMFLSFLMGLVCLEFLHIAAVVFRLPENRLIPLELSASERIMQFILKPLLWATFGTMDAVTAYRTLPAAAKDHVTANNDPVIPPSASLYAALKADRRQEKQEAAHDEAELLNIKDRKLRGLIDPHNEPLSYLVTYHKKRHTQGISAELDIPFAENLPPHINGQEVVDNKTRRLLRFRNA